MIVPSRWGGLLEAGTVQEAGLLITLAEIAGIFVGFGALISVRAGGASDAREVLYLRSVLTMGLWVVVAGLTPATLGAYGVAGHELWLLSGLVALVGAVVVWAVNYWPPDVQAYTASMSRSQLVREMVGNAVLLVPMLFALLLVVLGPFPAQEPALYLTAVVLGLFATGLTLLWLVFSHRPMTASAEVDEPATREG
jgi:hypothetical protein